MSKKAYNPMPEGLDREDRPAPSPLPPEIENREDIIIKLLESVNGKLDKIIDNIPIKTKDYLVLCRRLLW